MLESFGHAIHGHMELLRTQQNFRVHLAVALLAVILAVALAFSAVEWAFLVVTIALVLAMEGLNTGIEIAVTLASLERRPEARRRRTSRREWSSCCYGCSRLRW